MNEKLIEIIVRGTRLATYQQIRGDIIDFFNKYKQDLSIGMILKYLETMIDSMNPSNLEVNNNDNI